MAIVNSNEKGELEHVALIHSPDDGGWYAERENMVTGTVHHTNGLYNSQAALLEAMRNGSAIWVHFSG